MNNQIVNYKKRKNLELFKSLEKLGFIKTQNYIPLYKKFFLMNETNYASINLNNKLYISSVLHNIADNQNLYECNIKNSMNDKSKTKKKNVFFKLAPLLDPVKFMIGKYDINDTSLITLPSLNDTNVSVNHKLLDVNNCGYVDNFFSYLTNQLKEKYNFLHGVEYYGSYLSIKQNLKINVFDDLDYLIKSEYFNKHKNILFDIEDYSELIDDTSCDINKPVIKIDDNINPVLNITEFDDTCFDNLFDDEVSCIKEPSTTTINDDSILLLTEDNLKDITSDLKSNNSKTTSLKSDTSCSSRTSHTRSDDEISDDSGEWSEINSEDEDCSDSEEDDTIYATFKEFPVQVICMEKCEDTLDSLILDNDLKEIEWFSALMQIIMTLLTYQKVFSFTHNDLHTNNIMYSNTSQKYIYYCFKNNYYRVPTFGKIFKIIDFGRGIYKYDGNIMCSDSFSFGGDAATQYNTEPYYNNKKPRLEPNYSFDLCRLACSIFDYVVDDMDSIKEIDKCDAITRIIVEWCLDDNGLNVLYKNNGADRYPDFKLYKMIARCVHNHTPQAQLQRKEFHSFTFPKKNIPENEKIINIDEMISSSG